MSPPGPVSEMAECPPFGRDGVKSETELGRRRSEAIGPEAGVHRDAEIRPQLEHKPTWRGHRECAAA